MSAEPRTELEPAVVDDALRTYAAVQTERVKALHNLHRAVFAESLVATLLQDASQSRDPAHDFDVVWSPAGVDIRIEVKCSGEFLPRYGLEHRSPASWSFPVQKQVWDDESGRRVSNDAYRFDVLVLARHVGDSLGTGWTFYVLNADEATAMGGRATARTVRDLASVLPSSLPSAVLDAHNRLRDSSNFNAT